MPLIQITLLKGRTSEQKRRIAQRITEVMVEEGKADRDAIVVTFIDVEARQLRPRRRPYAG
jgi:4-oxalocrotonate tautomerase family enzyme